MAMILAASQACIAILKPLDEYKTTYPNKVFDYMASGKPIVLAIDGVIREVVEDAHCGTFVEPGNATALANAVISLYQQPQYAAELGRNGRNYLREHFDRQILAEKLLKLIEII
jgi:glycosyltransferase involved in cell wall biosynthesis